MARVKGALNTRKRHKKILKLAKGFRGAESKQFRIANQAVMRSMQNAYVGRKRRKRDFRRLWITRISAACKQNGMNYSTFMNGLKKSGIEMNRKMLSEIAIADSVAFAKLVETAKAVEAAGAFLINLEGMPVGVAKRITETLTIPTMGIGAGKYCDSQDLVWPDIMGINDWVPKFAKKYCDLRTYIVDGLNQFADDVNSGAFPTKEYSYNTVVEGYEVPEEE